MHTMRKLTQIFIIFLMTLSQVPGHVSAASVLSASNRHFRVDPDTGLPVGQAVPTNLRAPLERLNSSSLGKGSQLPSQAAGYHLETVKQFEEKSYYLKDTAFISDTIGWAVGEPHWDQATKTYLGTIIKTIDGGLTWTDEDDPTTATLRGVAFVDASNGWAVGKSGTVLHTADGGRHWNAQVVPADFEFRYVFFLNALHGWVTGDKPIHVDSDGTPDNWQPKVWRTSDGGATWTAGTFPADASYINRIVFTDSLNGWTVGFIFKGEDEWNNLLQGTAIYHSSDGGVTWQTQYAPDLGFFLTSVTFLDSQHGFAAGVPNTYDDGIGSVFKTSDGGQTWQSLDGAFGTFWDIQFLDANRGYVVGLDYMGTTGPPVFRTFDGGTTWQSMPTYMNEGEGLFTVAVRKNLVIGLGDHDYVTRETAPWTACPGSSCWDLFTQSLINVHYYLKDVTFTDANNGWAVGARSFLPSNSGQVILHTGDGGQTWVEQYHKTPFAHSRTWQYLDSVFFQDALHGWATGQDNFFYEENQGLIHDYLLYTSDGGQTWTERGRELYGAVRGIELFDLQFTNPQEGWALSDNSCGFTHGDAEDICLAHTTDGGATWSWADGGGDSFGFFDGRLFFLNPQHGWFAGGQETVLHTVDNGSTWVFQDPPTSSNRLHDITFINEQEGWIAGEAFYHTTDGGKNWQVIDVGLQRDLNAIQFVNSRYGVTAGDWGNILYTDDGGASWRYATNDVSISTLHGLYFISLGKGWLVGEEGTILTTVATPFYEHFLPFIARVPPLSVVYN